MVKLQATPVDLIIIQTYLPTSDREDNEVDEVYERIEELLRTEKGQDYVIVKGGFNAIIGEEE